MRLILTSTEHMFWDTPREVSVLSVLKTDPPLVDCALLYVDEDQPDGPMWVVAAPRHGRPWSLDAARLPVMVWQYLEEPRAPVITDGFFHRPADHPQAWCTIVTEDDEEKP